MSPAFAAEVARYQEASPDELQGMIVSMEWRLAEFQSQLAAAKKARKNQKAAAKKANKVVGCESQ